MSVTVRLFRRVAFPTSVPASTCPASTAHGCPVSVRHTTFLCVVTSQSTHVNPSLRCPARSRTHEKNIAQRRAGVHSWQGASSCRCRRFVFDLFGQAKPLAWAVVLAHISHMESTRPARVNAHSHMPPWTDTPSPSQRPPPHMHRTSPHGRSIIRRRPWSVCQRRMVLCSS
jgi:hypothetical protein